MKPEALVFGVGWVAGLAAIRSLGRAGIRVVAFDDDRGALGFRSRYAEPRLSPPRTDGDALVACVEDCEGAVALPTNDPDLETLARSQHVLPCRYPFPSWDVLGRVQDKRVQLSAATKLGIATPRIAAAPTDELGYPVLVKPIDHVGFRKHFGVKAFRCATRSELEARFDEAREFEPMVQEWIPGGDDSLYTVGSYITREGEALGLFSGRKLLQTPREIGTARVAEARWLPDLVDEALRLLRELGVWGVSQVEFKRDARDGRFRLIEVNPRLWEWHGLAVACGVDLTHLAYLDAIGEKPRPVRMNGDGKRWAITLARGARPALQRPPYVDAMWARDDPRPALVHWARVVRP